MFGYWSYILTGAGVAALFFIGGNKRIGWSIGIGAQVLWLGYAIITHQYGFIIGAVVYGIMYGAGWVRSGQIKEDTPDEHGET